MDVAALTMMIFGVLIVGMGMTGLMVPHFLLAMLGFSSSPTTQIFVMASSQASLAMGLYYILAAVHETRLFFQWSVPMRIFNFMVFTSMVLLGIAPSQWLLVAGLELAGALATGMALASKNEFSLDRFNALRIASVVLAFLGAILAFGPFSIYGSASAFLVIFSAGFIYAYRKFAPARVGGPQ
ncbi:MAG: hypothetical protein ABI904_01410 [Chloroflexota bacterium]